MNKLSLISRILFILFLLPAFAFAQHLPKIGTINSQSVENLADISSYSLDGDDELNILNSGTVPLNFCLAEDATSTCVGMSGSVTVGPSTNLTVKISQIAGSNLARTYLNVSNTSLTIGSYSVTYTDAGGSAPDPQTPSVGSVPTEAIKNLASFPSTTDFNNLMTIANSGSVPLEFAFSENTSSAYTAMPGALTVAAGQSSTVTMAQLGASSTKTKFNVGNASKTTGGSYAVTYGAAPQTGGTKLPAEPYWQTGGNTNVNEGHYIGTNLWVPLIFKTSGAERMRIEANGKITLNSIGIEPSGLTTVSNDLVVNRMGIGTSAIGTNTKLAVEGLISAREVRVVTGIFPDYVFEKDYNLMGLKELEEYIEINKHLPNIPSACQVQENNGIQLGEMNVKLLEKVEELFLHVIQLQKQNEAMQQENKEIKIQLAELQK